MPMFERPVIPQRWAIIRKAPGNVTQYLKPDGELTGKRAEAWWTGRRSIAEEIRKRTLRRFKGLQVVDLVERQDLL